MDPFADEPVLDAWCNVLHERGHEAIDKKYQGDVLDLEWERIRHVALGYEYFKRHYGYLRVKGKGAGKGWQRFCPGGEARVSPTTGKSWDWQQELALVYPWYDIFLMEKTRQIGESFDLSLLGLHTALIDIDQAIVPIANKLKNAERLLLRSHQQYRKLPEWIRRRVRMTSPAMGRTKFSNGSTIEPMSGSMDTGRSEAASLILMDEAAFIEKLEDVWASVEASAEGGGKIIIVSTANGVGNLFYQWCVDGAAGDIRHNLCPGVEVRDGINDMGFVFLPWWMHPDRDDAWRERQMNRYRGSIKKFIQEFPSTWEEAFITTGLGYHDQPSLIQHERMSLEIHEPAAVQGSMIWTDRTARKAEFIEDAHGHVRMYADRKEFNARLESGRPFIIGADCAGDNPWGDYHAASDVHMGLGVTSRDRDLVPDDDKIKHAQIATIHGYMDADAYAELLMMLGFYSGTCEINPEANGIGQAVIHYLRRERYPRIYMRKTAADVMNQGYTWQHGWMSTVKTKHLAAGETEAMLRMERVDGLVVPGTNELEIRDVETIRELRGIKFQGGQSIGAPEPNHDDRAVGLWLACVRLDDLARAPGTSLPTPVDPIKKILKDAKARRAAGARLGSESVRR